MFTADQFVAHIIGDYVCQSDWMATEKTKKSVAALAHVITYTLCFVFITRNPIALALILGTHFVIDRWRLARYVCWAKNFLAPKYIEIKQGAGIPVPPNYAHLFEGAPLGEDKTRTVWIRNHPWKECVGTGYAPDKPPWMTVWLMIVADNAMHALCNGLAIHLFP